MDHVAATGEPLSPSARNATEAAPASPTAIDVTAPPVSATSMTGWLGTMWSVPVGTGPLGPESPARSSGPPPESAPVVAYGPAAPPSRPESASRGVPAVRDAHPVSTPDNPTKRRAVRISAGWTRFNDLVTSRPRCARHVHVHVTSTTAFDRPGDIGEAPRDRRDTSSYKESGPRDRSGTTCCSPPGDRPIRTPRSANKPRPERSPWAFPRRRRRRRSVPRTWAAGGAEAEGRTRSCNGNARSRYTYTNSYSRFRRRSRNPRPGCMRPRRRRKGAGEAADCPRRSAGRAGRGTRACTRRSQRRKSPLRPCRRDIALRWPESGARNNPALSGSALNCFLRPFPIPSSIRSPKWVGLHCPSCLFRCRFRRHRETCATLSRPGLDRHSVMGQPKVQPDSARLRSRP